jgi:para-nitrobenzyl esterase
MVDGRAVPEHPFYPKAPTISADVPLLVGTAKDECRLHLGAADSRAFDIGWDDLAPRLAGAMGQDPAEAIGFYRETFPTLSAGDLLFKIFTFWRWRHSAIWQAERKAEQNAAAAYVYRVDWETPVDGGKWRAPHTIEIPFVFDNIDKSASLLGGAPTAQRMADIMSGAWVAFARTGRPQTPDLPRWPAYDPTTRKTLRFNLKSSIATDLESEERRFFANAPPRLPL